VRPLEPSSFLHSLTTVILLRILQPFPGLFKSLSPNSSSLGKLFWQHSGQNLFAGLGLNACLPLWGLNSLQCLPFYYVSPSRLFKKIFFPGLEEKVFLRICHHLTGQRAGDPTGLTALLRFLEPHSFQKESLYDPPPKVCVPHPMPDMPQFFRGGATF